MIANIKKAVIPVAGLGTRMLPATKAIPKELLPVYDRPIIEHLVKRLSQPASLKSYWSHEVAKRRSRITLMPTMSLSIG